MGSSSCTIILNDNLNYGALVSPPSAEEGIQAASAITAMPEVGSFIKVIQPDTLKNGSIELPQGFLTKYGQKLPKDAYLESPTGAMWKVELIKNQGRVWLRRGLQDFAEHCSIKSGYLVVFRYDGGSIFHVLIFDTTSLEIEYPGRQHRVPRKGEALKRIDPNVIIRIGRMLTMQIRNIF